MQQSYARDMERENERLHRQLANLGFDDYSARTSSAMSPYQSDDLARGWSPWPDTTAHD